MSATDYKMTIKTLNIIEKSLDKFANENSEMMTNETSFRAEVRQARRAVHLIKSFLMGSSYEEIERITRKHVNYDMLWRVFILSMSTFIEENFLEVNGRTHEFIIHGSSELDPFLTTILYMMGSNQFLFPDQWNCNSETFFSTCSFIITCHQSSLEQSIRSSS